VSVKREKFVLLAEKRVNRTIKDIRLIANLSNKNNYAYNDKDVNKIIWTLEQEIKMLKVKFSAGDAKGEPTFKL
jgi:hypothetical protein